MSVVVPSCQCQDAGPCRGEHHHGIRTTRLTSRPASTTEPISPPNLAHLPLDTTQRQSRYVCNVLLYSRVSHSNAEMKDLPNTELFSQKQHAGNAKCARSATHMRPHSDLPTGELRLQIPDTCHYARCLCARIYCHQGAWLYTHLTLSKIHVKLVPARNFTTVPYTGATIQNMLVRMSNLVFTQ